VPTPKKKNKNAPSMLLNEKVPLAHRRMLLADICNTESDDATAMLDALYKAAAQNNGGEDLYKEKTKEVDQLIEGLVNGPQRPGTFLNMLTPKGAQPTRALVKLADGTPTYPVVPDANLAKTLKRGDSVLLSTRAEAVLSRDDGTIDVGEEAKLERWLGDRVEVSIRTGDDRHLLHVTEQLRDRLEAGEVPTGSLLLVCLRRAMAFDVIPRETDELSGFRFLCREPVPDVIAERDIGDPPAFIEEIAEVCRQEMFAPELRRQYRLRRSTTVLLTGVSGSGKTLSLNASIRRIYEVMSQATGLPIEELPPRVMRLKMSKLLSQWLGQSDQNADRLFDEMSDLTRHTVTAPDGREIELPVIVVLEEIDGIARRRGLDHDGIYDRIQTTLLQRLDHTANAALRDGLIIVFATTNVPDLIDPAWFRRVGGRTYRFGRLRHRGFAAVLTKQLRDRPLASENGTPADILKRGLVRDATAGLFSSPNDEEPLVEIQFAGSTTPTFKHRRDFLTGSVVDRAVQQAATAACDAQQRGTDKPGITAAMVLEAIDDQVQSVVGSITPANVGEFVDLPDGQRVTNVRRIDPPSVSARDIMAV
jgi:hypothetical protein